MSCVSEVIRSTLDLQCRKPPVSAGVLDQYWFDKSVDESLENLEGDTQSRV